MVDWDRSSVLSSILQTGNVHPRPPIPRAGGPAMRSFKSLSEKEILALAIALEEEDAKIYGDFVDGLRAGYPATADMFTAMRHEEEGHRHRLTELFRKRFGEHIPHVRREDVKGFVRRRP